MGGSEASGGGEGAERERRLELDTDDPRVQVKRAEPHSERLRSFRLVIAAIAVAFGCTGVVVGFRWYQQATEIERQNPIEVLQQYLRARFNSPTPDRVGLFVCGDPKLADLESVLDALAERERTASAEIEVGIANFTIDSNGKSSVVKSDLVISYSVAGNVALESQEWEFDFIEQDGWRLCGSRQV